MTNPEEDPTTDEAKVVTEEDDNPDTLVEEES